MVAAGVHKGMSRFTIFSPLAIVAIVGALRISPADDTTTVATPENSVPRRSKTFSSEDLSDVRAAESARIAAIGRAYPTVVAIYGNDRQGGGSGVLFDPAGYALTNHHVIAGAGESGWAGLSDGRLYRWQLLGTDPGGDVAIIQLQGRNDFAHAPLADSETVRVGDWAMAMGNPFLLAEDQRPTVTLGVVSGVHRFQEGQGNNMLVYGNCLQVDTSINPGNSGGPLFDIRGRIIGINGRCSFEERGRVNVGLGYAISSNQARQFVPDLLATKLAQHGTLDVIFGTRSTGVVCQSMNLSSAAARAGLKLGDRVVEFEGVPIRTANELTNWISTFPADWPVSLTYERDGELKTIHVRLTALPYNIPKAPVEVKRDDPAPPDRARPVNPDPTAGYDEGKIRWIDRNRAVCKTWIRRLQESLALSPEAKEVRVADKIVEGDESVGESQLHISTDGRIKLSYRWKAKQVALGYDGKVFWRASGMDAPQELDRNRWLQDPLAGQALALSLAVARETKDNPFASPLGQPTLEGSDKAGGQATGRIAFARSEADEAFYVWMGYTNTAGLPAISLIKGGLGRLDDDPIPAALFGDERTGNGVVFPFERRLVRGFVEKMDAHLEAQEVVSSSERTDEMYAMPKVP
jgi:serine protease Do